MNGRPGEKSGHGPPLLILSLPFLLYLLPFFFGLDWNAINPRTPHITGLAYKGRLPNAPCAVEWYGTGVVVVPFHARVRDYLSEGELPLWNPYQGLGQPFAAQGEGCPYSPLIIVRAMIGYSHAGWLTIAFFYVSTVFLYLFGRNLGLSSGSAIVAGVMWGLSGALTLHIARHNIADQVCMIPVFFWACERALIRQSPARYAILTIVSAFHLLAGFVQISLGPLLLVVPFSWVYLRTQQFRGKQIFRSILAVLIAICLGHGLTAFYLLPMAEGMRVFANKNVDGLGFLPMSYVNVVTFFFPHAFGHLFHSWIAGDRLYRVDWDNLYAYSGTMILLLNLMGWHLCGGFPRKARTLFLFFSAAAGLLLLRYVGFPAVAGINWLPIVGRQSPKHILGTVVFTLIMAAGFVIDYLRVSPWRQTRWTILISGLAMASLVLTAIAKQSGFEAVDGKNALRCLAATGFIVSVLLLVLWLGRRQLGLLPDQRSVALLLGFTAAGELAIYLPLGNAGNSFLIARLAMFAACVTIGFLFAQQRRRLAILGLAGVAVGYTLLIVLPEAGLPGKLEVENIPPFMTWLQRNARSDFRSFGIYPDYSSLGKIQDIGAVGPLAPHDYYHFVDLAAPELARWTRNISIFCLAFDGGRGPHLPGDVYVQRRAIFDWVGVRFLVLENDLPSRSQTLLLPRSQALPGTALPGRLCLPDPPGRDSCSPPQVEAEPLRQCDPRQSLGPREQQSLGPRLSLRYALEAANDSTLRRAYQDDHVTVFESLTAQRRAIFSLVAKVYPDQEAILQELATNPDAILGTPLIEKGALNEEAVAALSGPVQGQSSYPVLITESSPNRVRLAVAAPAAGLVLLKDCFCPGWSATCNGAPAEIIRVNGFARGVYVNGPGDVEICFRYRPMSFVTGMGLAIAVAGFLLATAIAIQLRSCGRMPRWIIIIGFVGASGIVYLCAAAYFGQPPF